MVSDLAVYRFRLRVGFFWQKSRIQDNKFETSGHFYLKKTHVSLMVYFISIISGNIILVDSIASMPDNNVSFQLVFFLFSPIENKIQYLKMRSFTLN